MEKAIWANRRSKNLLCRSWKWHYCRAEYSTV